MCFENQFRFSYTCFFGTFSCGNVVLFWSQFQFFSLGEPCFWNSCLKNQFKLFFPFFDAEHFVQNYFNFVLVFSFGTFIIFCRGGIFFLAYVVFWNSSAKQFWHISMHIENPKCFQSILIMRFFRFLFWELQTNLAILVVELFSIVFVYQLHTCFLFLSSYSFDNFPRDRQSVRNSNCFAGQFQQNV